MVECARIVLASLQGKRNDEIAGELDVRPNTVGQWRRRFAESGIAGLRDAQARQARQVRGRVARPDFGAA